MTQESPAIDNAPTLRERLLRSPFPYLVSDTLAIAAAYYIVWQIRFQNEWGLRLFTWININLGVRTTGEVGPLLESFYWLTLTASSSAKTPPSMWHNSLPVPSI